jgi:RHS repeat-associated protein
VYDKADRLIASQDGVQRAKSQCVVNKYDALGRLLYTGTMANTDSCQALRNSIHNLVITESYVGSGGFASTGYSCTHFSDQITPLLVNYYDNHSFLSVLSQADANSLACQSMTGYGSQHTNSKGLLTGTRVKILGETGEIITATYYDYRRRVIQTRATNSVGGNDFVYNAYDFTGNVTKTLMEHTSDYDSPVNECYEYEYDHAGRLLSTTYTPNNGTSVVLAENTYDELGRLIEKKRHNETDTEEYEYNIRNWTTKITSGDFVENLYYENKLGLLGHDATAYYNGNISANKYTYNGQINGYMYYYDKLNRMTGNYSILNNGVQIDHEYSESFGYDKHGNIAQLTRWDNQDSMDQLMLTYNGNQVKKVADWGISQHLYSIKEYHDLADETTEFFYDSNGNLTADLDRKIVAIRYNLLNLPDTVQFENGNQILNRYDATGRKLQTEYVTALSTEMVTFSHTINTQGSDFTRYGTIYNNNKEYAFQNTGTPVLLRIHNVEGYVDFEQGAFDFYFDDRYHYYRKDHLGNVREVWRAPYSVHYMNGSSWAQENFPAAVVQKTQYYPSGLPWKSNTGDNPSTQPYKYNGKEFIETHGYDTYDYGARGLHSAKMRFETMDPLAEKYYSVSPYAYCLNNPVRCIDPAGKDIIVLNAPKGAFGFGHLAILIGNDTKGWTYISKDGSKLLPMNGPSRYTNSSEGMRTPAFSSEEDFNKSTYASEYNYTQRVRFITTDEQDAKAANAADKAAKRWYSMLFDNCADAVSEALDVVGLNPGYRWFGADNAHADPTTDKTAIPNVRFNKIARNNNADIYNVNTSIQEDNNSDYGGAWDNIRNTLNSWLSVNPNITVTYY